MLRQLRALQHDQRRETARSSEDLAQARARIRALEERLAEMTGELRVARSNGGSPRPAVAAPVESAAGGGSRKDTRALRMELRVADANKELAASREHAEHLHAKVCEAAGRRVLWSGVDACPPIVLPVSGARAPEAA